MSYKALTDANRTSHSPRRGSTQELDISDFRAVMETNYFGALRCIQAVLPQMRARKSGCIINVTSLSGRISVSPLGSYAASKFALEGLSEALAQEAKMFNIRVAIVQPGVRSLETLPVTFSVVGP